MDEENGTFETVPQNENVTSNSIPLPIIENHSGLIPYAKLTIENEENDQTLTSASKILPQIVISAGGYELFGISLYKSSVIEIIGSIGQSCIHVAIVYASQSFKYPPLQIGIATGIVIALYIYQFAMSSGAHFNALITISSMCTGHIPFIRGLIYIPCQLLGYYIGAEIMRAGLTREEALAYQLGRCNVGEKSYNQAFILEFIFCIMLLFPVYGTAFNPRQREIFGPIFPPILIGFTIGFLIFSGPSLGTDFYSGAGMNPTLCSGIALSIANVPGADSSLIFSHHSVYWLAPITACVSHAFIYTLMPPHHEAILNEKKIQKDV